MVKPITPSSLAALTDALGNAALRGEISWQVADRALTLAEESARRQEVEQEQRDRRDYIEHVATTEPEQLSEEDLWREQNLARAWWLQQEAPWLTGWQRRLQSLLQERQNRSA